MTKRSLIPQSRRHVHVYDEDWEFLAGIYSPDNGTSIRGPSHAIREIVHRQVGKIRERSERMIDQAKGQNEVAE